MIPILLIGGPYDHMSDYIDHKTWSLDIIKRSGDLAIAVYQYDFEYIELNSNLLIFRYAG